MALSKSAKIVLILLIVGVAAAILGLFLAFGPPQLYARTSTPEFCGSCHVMEMEYETWFHSGAHKRITCVDCHLPNDTKMRHLFWKSVDGIHDTVRFYSGQVSDYLRLSSRGEQVVRENCQRCHSEIGARINETRNCWTCHRRLTHRLSGVRLTQQP